MGWSKLDSSKYSYDKTEKEVTITTAKLGSFAIGKPSRRPVGGRIFYDNKPEDGITYKFYKQDGTEIKYEYDSSDATHVVTALQDAYEYEVLGGEPSVDRFYVFNNELKPNVQWGKYNKFIGITSDGIGLGKFNTQTALTKDTGTVWEDNSIFKYISDFNDSNETGCKDWYIGSKAEQEKLVAVANTVSITWYNDNWIWSSVESEYYTGEAYFWNFDNGRWRSYLKGNVGNRYGCFAQRSF